MKMYIAARSEPPVDALAALAIASGYCLDWLISGEGRERCADPLPAGATPDPEAIFSVIQRSELALRKKFPRAAFADDRSAVDQFAELARPLVAGTGTRGFDGRRNAAALLVARGILDKLSPVDGISDEDLLLGVLQALVQGTPDEGGARDAITRTTRLLSALHRNAKDAATWKSSVRAVQETARVLPELFELSDDAQDRRARRKRGKG